MNRIRKLLILFILACNIGFAYGQFNTEMTDTINNKILFERIKSYGPVVHNLGYGLRYKTGKRKSISTSVLWEFEGVYMYSYRQVKLINPYFAFSKKYVYGKINDVFFLRAGRSWKKQISSKPYWGGVEIRFTYGAGVSLGLAKPYYLYVIYFYEESPGVYNYKTKTEQFDPSNLSWDDIYGRAPFTKGLNEISLHPGIYAKAGFNFEFGTSQIKLRALEVGVTVDFIPMGVSIMSTQSNNTIYPSFYLNYSFGKRFNKY
jgi:hypothetical protein